MDGFRDGCGLFGVAGDTAASSTLIAGLRAIQHRGGRGFHLAASDGRTVRAVRVEGPVRPLSTALDGALAIGQVYGGLGVPEHARLPLDGGDRLVRGHTAAGPLAVALAGRFTNGVQLRAELEEHGALFSTGHDAEIFLHLIAQSPQTTIVNKVVDALWKLAGAFNILLLGPDIFVAVRGPHGFRPMFAGQLDGALLIASEDRAILDLGGTVQRPLTPGEMLVLQRGTLQTVHPLPRQALTPCIQELVSLSRPDATVFGLSSYRIRRSLGERLGASVPCRAEVVLGADEEPFAIGFATATGIPYERALLPRADGWRVVRAVVEGRRVALVAGSLLRGEPLRAAIVALREAGCTRLSVRIATPPLTRACLYGVPSPTTEEFVSARRPDQRELAEWLGADDVAFLPLDAMLDTLGERVWCTACFTGTYPVEPTEADDQLPLF